MKTYQDKIALEYNYDNYQKINWSILTILLFIILVATVGNPMNFLTIGLTLFLILSISFLIILMFSKNGLALKNGKLYKADFFLNRLIFKTKLKLSGKKVFSILTSRKKQKTIASIASPDASYGYYSYEIYLLNMKHTNKEYIMSFRSEEISRKASEFILNNTNLRFEIYNPDFS